MLVKEFDHFILEHQEFADEIPDAALIVMQLEGDEKFNRWEREAAREQAEGGTEGGLRNNHQTRACPLPYRGVEGRNGKSIVDGSLFRVWRNREFNRSVIYL